MAKEGTIAYPEKVLMRAKDLLNRWIGATEEEIVIHNQKGELQAFKRHKGPIKGIIWCIPYELRYHNETQKIWELPDYFLIDDILKCEKSNSEYTGNINPSDYENNSICNDINNPIPLHDGLSTYSAFEVMHMLGFTPIELVDRLNGQRVHVSENEWAERRLITTEEEGYRSFTYNEPYFDTDSLRNVTIYKKDLKIFCDQWGYEINLPPDKSSLDKLIHEIKVLKFQKRILKEEYDNQIVELTQRCETLQADYQVLHDKFIELQRAAHSKNDDDPDQEKLTTRQKETLNAAGEILIEIGNGKKTDYKFDEFHNMLSSRYSEYMTEIERQAWRLLPERFKHGAGRPKNNPENPEK